MNRNTLFAACLLILTQQALSQTSGPTLKAYCPWRTFLGTGNNAGCATTWSYKGIVYNNECTTRDHFRPWCSTVSGDFSILQLWGNCDMNTNCEYYCGNFTTGGTMGGAPCKFPFTYNGVVYNSCTAVDHPRMWCTDQPVYAGRWGNCQYDTAVCSPTYCTDRTFLGTALGAPCAVPFTYKGVVYNECTSVEHFRPWCSTTSTFSGAWGNCLDRNCPALCTGVTAGGTAGQAPCVFPFTYRGQTFEKCTGLDNNNVLWCSTTPIYTRFWGNCVYAENCN